MSVKSVESGAKAKSIIRSESSSGSTDPTRYVPISHATRYCTRSSCLSLIAERGGALPCLSWMGKRKKRKKRMG